jgi:glucose dehydrogenase
VLRGHEGGPLIVGNMMYVHTPFPNKVFALDLANDGKIVWKYEPKQDPSVIPVMCCDTVNRGPAYASGKLFLHQADTTVVALDAKTGQVLWSVANGDPGKGETNTATVLPVKDKVIVGISGGEFGVRGSVTAYNMDTGEQEWRAYSMGPDEDMLIDPENTTRARQADRRELLARTPGKATSGRSAAAPPGAGTPMIRKPTCSITAPATPRPGTRRSARATTSGR